MLSIKPHFGAVVFSQPQGSPGPLFVEIVPKDGMIKESPIPLKEDETRFLVWRSSLLQRKAQPELLEPLGPIQKRTIPLHQLSKEATALTAMFASPDPKNWQPYFELKSVKPGKEASETKSLMATLKVLWPPVKPVKQFVVNNITLRAKVMSLLRYAGFFEANRTKELTQLVHDGELKVVTLPSEKSDRAIFSFSPSK